MFDSIPYNVPVKTAFLLVTSAFLLLSALWLTRATLYKRYMARQGEDKEMRATFWPFAGLMIASLSIYLFGKVGVVSMVTWAFFGAFLLKVSHYYLHRHSGPAPQEVTALLELSQKIAPFYRSLLYWLYPLSQTGIYVGLAYSLGALS